MIRSMKLFGSLIALAFLVCILAYPCLAWDSGAVREKLSLLKQQMGGDIPGYHQLKNEVHELGLSSNAVFRAMAQMVSDEWTCALADMDSITTNHNERLMVIYAGVGLGETNFLVRINQMADFVLSNKVSLTELRFYKVQCGISDHHATSSLIRRYQEPSISNLIMKLNAVGAYPQGVSDIFSGEAKELYLDAVHDGVIAP